MKILIVTGCLLLCILGKAQTTTEYVSANGYWVVVGNIKVAKEATLQCYNDQNKLIYEERITGRKLKLKKASTLRYFKLILDKEMAVYANTKTSFSF